MKAEWNILSEKPGQCLEIGFGGDFSIDYCASDEEPQPGFHDLVVYLRRDLDPQLKLLLASAMTAIMEYKDEALFED